MAEDEVMKTSEVPETPETRDTVEHYELPLLEDILKELEGKIQDPDDAVEETEQFADLAGSPEGVADQPDRIEQKWEAPEQDPSAEIKNNTGGAEDSVQEQPSFARSRKKERKAAEENVSWQENLLMSLHDVVYLMAALMIVFIFLFRIVVVSGSSMYSTLWHGDYLLVMSSVIYGDPEYGDIIVASKDSFNDGEPIIKRVIATEGQTVDIDFDAGIVYVDGVALEEDYTYTLTTVSEGVEFPLTVSEGCVFAMGDNRDRSRDSRYPDIGLIDEREILGKAVFLFWPGTGDDSNEAPRDFSRIGVVN